MKTIRYLIFFFIGIHLANLAKCQVTSDSGCETIETNQKTLNDSLSVPIYYKGYNYLSQTISKYFFYTDSMQCDENEFRLIDFWIEINKKGKIIDHRLSFENNVSKQLISDFPILIKEIDSWRPSYDKGTNLPTNKYRIFFRIEVHSEKINIRFLNSDAEELYEYIIKRPIAQNL